MAYICICIYTYMAVCIKTRGYVEKINEGVIGENVEILIKFELSESRGVAKPCPISRPRKMLSQGVIFHHKFYHKVKVGP